MNDLDFDYSMRESYSSINCADREDHDEPMNLMIMHNDKLPKTDLDALERALEKVAGMYRVK